MFENYFEKLLFRVYKLSKWKLILLALIFDSFVLILNLMIDVSTNFNRSDEGDDFPRLSFIILFVGPVILSPILETLFFQTLLFRIGKRIPLNDGLVVVISSFIFALAHRLNITDIFFFFLRGLILCGYYLILKNRKEKAFWPTCLLHATHNFFVVIPYWAITFYERLYGKLE